MGKDTHLTAPMITPIYARASLEKTITLQPHQLDNHLPEYLLETLTRAVQGQVGPTGMVMRVEEITSYSRGQINKINSMGLVTYEVVYNCIICSPTIGMEIPVRVTEKSVPGFLQGELGPVTVFCETTRSDRDQFSVDDDARAVWNDTGRHVASGDIVRVVIDKTMDYSKRGDIPTLGHLVGRATEAEMTEATLGLEEVDQAAEEEFI